MDQSNLLFETYSSKAPKKIEEEEEQQIFVFVN